MLRLRSHLSAHQRLLCLALAIMALWHPATAAAEGQNWALLVGIDQYRNPDVSPLEYSVADVKAVATALQGIGYSPDHVFTMTGDHTEDTDPQCPTNVNVFKRLDTLTRKIGPEDTLLFYFTGHGFQRENGQNFLGTINTDPSDLDTLQLSTIPLTLLREKLKKVKARQVIFILDACRNDPEKGKGDSNNTQTNSFTKNLVTVAASSSAGPKGTAVLFACSDGQRSWEWPEKGHGAFTYYLLEGMKGAAAEPDGTLTVNGLASYAQSKLKAWSDEQNKVQAPDLELQGGARLVLGTRNDGSEEIETRAILRVASEPAGAGIYVDGVDTGQRTPAKVYVDLGVRSQKSVEIGLHREGSRDRVEKVVLVRGQNPELSWPLEPPPSPGPLPHPSPPSPIPTPGNWPPQPPAVQQGSIPNPPITAINPKDGAEMIFIPAGTFKRGITAEDIQETVRFNSSLEPDYFTDETPQRQVYLSSYWMYKNDVTVAQYKQFCQATGHALPKSPRWGLKDDHPVVKVSWDDAMAYCDWAGVNLPTEAQGEKAARGTDGRKFPWGNSFDGSFLSHSTGTKGSAGSTSPIGSYPAGASPYGCLDMAGNVCQWCADLYGENYYKVAPAKDPLGPTWGPERVLRGNSWYMVEGIDFRCASRGANMPGGKQETFGFRCAMRAGS